MTEFEGYLYHPGCIACERKGIACPDDSRSGPHYWTSGTLEQPPSVYLVNESRDSFKNRMRAQRATWKAKQEVSGHR